MDDVVIVGAGVIGLACAVEFQRRGLSVLLIDQGAPGRLCSFGNAGIIAASEVFPLVSPAHIRRLPQMLLSRDAPASIRLNAFPQLAGWMLRAARTLSPARQQAIANSLGALNRLALPAWRDLLEDCGARDLLIEKGMLRLLRDERDRPDLERHRAALAARDIAATIVSARDVRALEPNLGDAVVGGLLHESDAHVRSPLAISLALFDRFVGAGGIFCEDRVTAVVPGDDGVAVTTRSTRLLARRAIVAAGLHSAPLIEPLGVRAPLQAERGYHLMVPGQGHVLGRPVTFQAESCAATPMADGLRLAGTVEFADPGSAPTWSRAMRLAPIAERYLGSPLPHAGSQTWVGSRPSLPDSLPAIGWLRRNSAIGYAFGHQHLGLTQAAATAQLLVRAMSGGTTDIDLQPFAIERF